ncbi:MAG: hypothetical protein COA39_004500 [Sulfurimonas sp.]|nr:hypothetical protein [Sulfurimonas sp.]
MTFFPLADSVLKIEFLFIEKQPEIDMNTARILTPIAFLMETGKISIVKEKYLVI